MIIEAWSWLQVLIEPRVDKEEMSTDEGTELIWLLLRPALELPRAVNICGVIVLMLDAKAAETFQIKYQNMCKQE